MTLIVKWSDSKDTEEMYSKHLSAIYFTYNAILYLNKKDTKTNSLHEIEINIFQTYSHLSVLKTFELFIIFYSLFNHN